MCVHLTFTALIFALTQTLLSEINECNQIQPLFVEWLGNRVGDIFAASSAEIEAN